MGEDAGSESPQRSVASFDTDVTQTLVLYRGPVSPGLHESLVDANELFEKGLPHIRHWPAQRRYYTIC